MQIQKTKSWYGSLSRKSTASLSIQKETIAGSPLKAGSTPDFHRYDLTRNGDNASLSGASQDTLTKLDETADDTTTTMAENNPNAPDKSGYAPTYSQNDQTGSQETRPENTADATDTTKSNAPSSSEDPQRPTTSSGWLGGWFSRAPVTAEKPEETEDKSQAPVEPPVEPESPVPGALATAPAQTTAEQPDSANGQRPASSWFNFWPIQSAPDVGHQKPAEAPEPQTVDNQESTDVPLGDEPAADPGLPSKPSAGSTWAFWSRDQPKSAGKQPQTSETGELAVVGERSERHPKRTKSVDMGQEAPTKQEPPKQSQTEPKTGSIKTKKKSKTQPQPISVERISRPQTPQSDTASIAADSPSKSKSKASGTAAKPTAPNLLLPSFRTTYRMKENPSILKQIASLLLRTQQQPTKHVFLSEDLPKIKKALAIGVHGLFPATYRALICLQTSRYAWRLCVMFC